MATKVFCVGLQKTGLTSLLTLMRQSGFESHGASGKRRRQFFVRRDYKGLLDYYDTADFFCDWPTPLMYRPILKRYGDDALFILTVRESARTWFESMMRHNAYAHPLLNRHYRVFGRYYPHGFADEHIGYYEQHNKDVTSFFETQNRSSQLLVLRVDEEGAVRKLSEFLDLDLPFENFPRENVSATERKDIGSRFKRNYNRIVLPIYESLAPRIRPTPPKQFHALEVADF